MVSVKGNLEVTKRKSKGGNPEAKNRNLEGGNLEVT